MSEARDFWGGAGDFDSLVERTRSNDPLERWAAAFELGELGDERAADRLRMLLSDSDEFVREAADSALRKLDPDILRRASAAHAAKAKRLRSSDEAADYRAWRTRPLPQPSSDSVHIVSTVVMEIVDVEGPVRGHRVMSLYGCAVNPDRPSSLRAEPVRRTIRELVRAGRIVRCDDGTCERVDDWVVNRSDGPTVLVRRRGPRELKDIPADEVRAAFYALNGVSAKRRGFDDAAFAQMLEFYGAERQLHLVAGLLTEEWRSLLG